MAGKDILQRKFADLTDHIRIVVSVYNMYIVYTTPEMRTPYFSGHFKCPDNVLIREVPMYNIYLCVTMYIHVPLFFVSRETE